MVFLVWFQGAHSEKLSWVNLYKHTVGTSIFQSSYTYEDLTYSPIILHPETNIAPENRPSQKETSIYSNHPFSGAMLVSGSVQYIDLKKTTYIYMIYQLNSVSTPHEN